MFAQEKAPTGIPVEDWHKVYNCADSKYANYHKRNGISGKDLEVRQKAARVDGRTQLLAHKILDDRIERGDYQPGGDYRSPAAKDAVLKAPDNDNDFEARKVRRLRIRTRSVVFGCRRPVKKATTKINSKGKATAKDASLSVVAKSRVEKKPARAKAATEQLATEKLAAIEKNMGGGQKAKGVKKGGSHA